MKYTLSTIMAFILHFSFAQVGIGVERPLSELHIKGEEDNSEIRVDAGLSARLSLNAPSSSGIYWNDDSNQKAAAVWSGNTMKLYSSPRIQSGLLNYFLPTLTLNEQRQVGVNVPLLGNPSQALDVYGKIKVGNDEVIPNAGTIRWNEETEDFEGYDGHDWKSLTGNNNQGIEGSGFGKISNIHQIMLRADDFDIDGDFAMFAMGAPIRKVHVYQRSGNSWTFFQEIDMVASKITISGDHMAAKEVSVGIKTYIFDGNLWVENHSIAPPAESGLSASSFGNELEMYNNKLAIGTYSFSKSYPVYVYTRHSSGIWLSYQEIQDTNNQPGDLYGYSLALDDDDLVIGAPNTPYNTYVDVGKAFHYKLNNGTFSLNKVFQLATFEKNDNQKFGLSVAVGNDQIAIGYSETHNSTPGNGSILFYNRNQTNSPEYQIYLQNNSGTYKLIPSINIKGNFMIIGNEYLGISKNGDCNTINEHQGQISIYKYENNFWNKLSEFIDPSGTTNDFLGSQVQISAEGWFISQYQRNTTEIRKKVVIGKAE